MLKRRKISVILGKAGYGKSQFLKDNVIGQMSRCVIFDVQREYDFSGYSYFYDIQEFQKWLASKADNGDMNVRAILRFEEMADYEIAFHLCYVCGNLSLFVEELWNYCHSTYINPTLEKLLRTGRHKAVSVHAVTHRLSDLHMLFRMNIDLLLCFHIGVPNDIEHLRGYEFIGDRADDLPRLARDEYIAFWND